MNTLFTDEDLNNYDAAEADNSHWVSQKVMLESLQNKPYFKTLIEQGYFKDYVFELAMQLVDPQTVRDGSRNAIMERIVGVAKLQEYFDMVNALSYSEEGYQEKVEEEYLKEKGRLTKLAAALEEAEKDKEFKELVANNYCTQYAASQTSMLTNPHVVRGGHRSEVLEALAGISTLRNYLVGIRKDLANMSVGDEEGTEE